MNARTVAATAATTLGVSALLAAMLGLLPESAGQLGAALAVIGSLWLMLQSRNRPLAAAFELGYVMGRRDSMRAANGGGSIVALRPKELVDTITG